MWHRQLCPHWLLLPEPRQGWTRPQEPRSGLSGQKKCPRMAHPHSPFEKPLPGVCGRVHVTACVYAHEDLHRHHKPCSKSAGAPLGPQTDSPAHQAREAASAPADPADPAGGHTVTTEAETCCGAYNRLGASIKPWQHHRAPRARLPRDPGPRCPDFRWARATHRLDVAGPSSPNPSEKPTNHHCLHLAMLTSGPGPETGAELCSEGPGLWEGAGRHLAGSPAQAGPWDGGAQHRSQLGSRQGRECGRSLGGASVNGGKTLGGQGLRIHILESHY